MRYRISNYTINGQVINLYKEDGSDLNVTIEDIRLVINETKNKVICSSMQKGNVTIDNNSITVHEGVCVLEDNDQLTIEIDQGDNIYDIIYQIDDDVSLQLKQILGYD